MRQQLLTIAGFVLASIGCASLAGEPAQGPSDAGRTAFEKRCTGCHALDREKVGPRLKGVFGRKAGTVPNFSYSDALKGSGVVWDESNLDKWLADPDSVLPGNDMSFRLDDARERAAIIAFLKQL